MSAPAIYLDANATTPLHPEVLEAMMPYLTDCFHNPSSPTLPGRRARKAIDRARQQVAALIGSDPQEIVFTGCGTESNNLALRSMAAAGPGVRTTVVTTAVEHSAVLGPCERLRAAGYDVVRCGVDAGGRLHVDEFQEAVHDDRPGCASVMWCNNETGVIQPVAETCALAKAAGWLFHSDAVQAAGKLTIDVRETPADYLSMSAHKIHGPKGIGALYVRRGAPVEPLVFGGGQEGGIRSGTENVAAIVGFGAAAELVQRAIQTDGHAALARRRDRLEARLRADLEGVTVHGTPDHRAPNVVHASFGGCDSAALLILLDEAGVNCAAGSACMTGRQEPSHVLTAMGLSPAEARGSLRLSLSLLTTDAEIESAADAIEAAVHRARRR